MKRTGGKFRFPSPYARFDGKIGHFGKSTVMFLFGGFGYGLIEVLWRGRTHWSMVLCGGICFLTMHLVNTGMRRRSIFLRAFVCMLCITAVEFAVGCIVNIGLHLDIWDYSEMKFQLLGQVCLLYSFFWYLLSLAVSAGSNFAARISGNAATQTR